MFLRKRFIPFGFDSFFRSRSLTFPPPPCSTYTCPTSLALRPKVSNAQLIRSDFTTSLGACFNFHDEDEKIPLNTSSKQKILRNTIATSSLVAATAAFAYPAVSNALDLASISGGTAGLATSTNSFFSGLSETGFYQSFSLVFLSEIGDKTFFIAGLLAMKTSRLISFIGSMSALAIMTVISVLIGQIFHVVPNGIAEGIPLDDVAAVLAFAFFGFKTLKEALEMEEGASVMDEELADAEEAVEGSDTVKQSTTM